MIKRDYYEVLKISKDADEKEIKRAYRRLAIEFHPDRNPDNPEAEEKFKEAAEAYEVLSNPDRKRLYDQYGHDGLKNNGFSGFGGMEDIFSHFGDIFSDFFGFGGGMGGGRRSRKGKNLPAQVELTFIEAAKGCAKEVEVQHHVKCEECGGSGAKPGTEPIQCSTCKGQGQVAHQQGFFIVQTTCPSCRGAGNIIEDPCPECNGDGLTLETDVLKVTIPAGVEDGLTLRVPGKGEASTTGGPPGDLYVSILVENDPRFEREGPTLITTVPVTYTQLALGTTITVPLVEGETEAEVKPGTQPDEILILKNEGLPRIRRKGKGDLLVRMELKIPKKLHKEEEVILRDLAEKEGVAVTPPKRSFFSKLKSKTKAKN